MKAVLKEKLASKRAISADEAVMIADMVKRGTSIGVMRDIEAIKKSRSKVPFFRKF